MEYKPSDDRPRWMLEGTVYGSEAEYQRAWRNRQERRRRLLDGLGWDSIGDEPFDPEAPAPIT
jgi:hypothetical protein